MTVGQNIREVRKEKGLTQKQLGKKLGVGQTMIANYENNKKEPKLSTLNKIANALDVTMERLVDVNPDSATWNAMQSFQKIIDINNQILEPQRHLERIFGLQRQIADTLNVQADFAQNLKTTIEDREKKENLAIDAIENLIQSQGYEILIESDKNDCIYLKRQGEQYKVSAKSIFSLHDTTLDYFKFKLNEILQHAEKVEDTEA